ncbi:MAG: hypothetical protein WCC69_04410 [Pirellulales bacterium]
MSNNAVNRPSGRAASRLKAVMRRAADYRRRARRALTLALVAAGTAAAPSLASAQMGQTAMAPTGGVVNRAVNGFQSLNANGPGWLYYGINAADRGLGYRGSYMTLGGFVPMAEDDLGGFWAADLRGHLSEYGGFFSNVGAVRKQFIGGTLLGVGVYWDYDGDQNQYSDTVIPVGLGNTATFAGGHSYNQVGISGEWLTDYGNLRSNGYIPVGSTAQLVGPFLGNSLLCVNGVNAALGGADLEVGAYIPGLSDWAGMISVGGYALGNTRYSFPDGAAAVPWFGGVYTRLDMTFLNNWDFSLQANNDSYFDWTGFARLTYRMGASRRRNVPDQMEQPMMRNEHIVRAHQEPVVATNPATGAAWQVFHVDNTATPGGDGSAEAPFATLEEAVTRSTNDPYDIVYVHAGSSTANTPYITPVGGFMFGATNQYLIGEGSTLAIPTELCGNRAFFAGSQSDVYPVISNPIGPAIAVDQAGAQVNHLSIVGSAIGISDGGGIAAPGVATIGDVMIAGNGGAGQRGILIANSTGTFTFDNVRLSNLSNDGLVLAATNGRVTLTSGSFGSIAGTAIRVSGSNAELTGSNTIITATKGTAIDASGVSSRILLTSGTIANSTGDAVVASGAGSRIALLSEGNKPFLIKDSTQSALVASGSGASISASQVTITKTGNTAISVSGPSATVSLSESRVSQVKGNGVVVSGTSARFQMLNGSRISDATGDGIALTGTATNNSALVAGKSTITNVLGNGITSESGSIQVVDSTISGVGKAGISAKNVNGPNRAVWLQGGQIQNANDGGVVVLNSNLRIERTDPNDPSSKAASISDTGLYGVSISADTRLLPAGSSYNALVDSAVISNVSIGIGVLASADVNNPVPDITPPPTPPNLSIPIIDFTATNNQISASTNGITLSAVFDASLGAPGRPLSQINALITQNTLTASSGEDILLTTAGDPTTFVDTTSGVEFTAPAAMLPLQIGAGSQLQLENLNGGASVTISPANSRPNFNATLVPDLPPDAPTLP